MTYPNKLIHDEKYSFVIMDDIQHISNDHDSILEEMLNIKNRTLGHKILKHTIKLAPTVQVEIASNIDNTALSTRLLSIGAVLMTSFNNSLALKFHMTITNAQFFHISNIFHRYFYDIDDMIIFVEDIDLENVLESQTYNYSTYHQLLSFLKTKIEYGKICSGDIFKQ